MKLYPLAKEEIERLESRVYKLENLKGYSNEDIFPDTQFLKLDFKSISLKNIQTKFKYERYGDLVKPYYLEVWGDRVIFSFSCHLFTSSIKMRSPPLKPVPCIQLAMTNNVFILWLVLGQSKFF